MFFFCIWQTIKTGILLSFNFLKSLKLTLRTQLEYIFSAFYHAPYKATEQTTLYFNKVVHLLLLVRWWQSSKVDDILTSGYSIGLENPLLSFAESNMTYWDDGVAFQEFRGQKEHDQHATKLGEDLARCVQMESTMFFRKWCICIFNLII